MTPEQQHIWDLLVESEQQQRFRQQKQAILALLNELQLKKDSQTT